MSDLVSSYLTKIKAYPMIPLSGRHIYDLPGRTVPLCHPLLYKKISRESLAKWWTFTHFCHKSNWSQKIVIMSSFTQCAKNTSPQKSDYCSLEYIHS
jgi:hypothetical protein